MMKRSTTSRLLILAAMPALMLGGCVYEEEGDNLPDDVTAISDVTANFGVYKTFAIAEAPPNPENPPDDIPAGDRAILNQSIIDELKALGLNQTAEEGADLLVASFIRTEFVRAEVTGYWYDYYYGWYWGYYEQWYDEEIQYFKAGTLVIDAIDVRDRANQEDDRLVFRGAYMGLVNESASDNTDRIEEAVQLIFSEWPSESEEEE